MPPLSLVSRDQADWGYEFWPNSQTEEVAIVQRVGVYYPFVDILVFDSIIGRTVRDDTLLSSSALSSGRAAGKWAIMLDIKIKF